jgi:hypothetical protein
MGWDSLSQAIFLRRNKKSGARFAVRLLILQTSPGYEIVGFEGIISSGIPFLSTTSALLRIPVSQSW